MTKKQLICETIWNCTNKWSLYSYYLGNWTCVYAYISDDDTLQKVISELMEQCYQDWRQYWATYDV